MRDKIYKILKVINECKNCGECPLEYFCESDDVICDYLEKLDNKYINEK